MSNSKERKIKISKVQANIIIVWLLIASVLLGPVAIIIPNIVYFFVKQDFFKGYYKQFAFDSSISIGVILCLIGITITEFVYYLKTKKSKATVTIIFMIISGVICSIIYVSMLYGYTYKYCRDLPYVMNGKYYEEVQSLKNIYKETSVVKGTTTSVYIDTEKFKFQAGEDIVEVKDFDKFKAKFSKVKKVKIGYLPNSNRLLYIEPIYDDEAKK